jgi:hypothetical protein
MIEWQPIETAPKDGSAVLLSWAIDADGNVIRWDEDLTTASIFVAVAWWCCHRCWWRVAAETPYDDSSGLGFAPTHWMPLPLPPEVPS